MSFDLQFLGGTGTVTGSKYLISYGTRNFLVDCGLFQGLKSLRLKNWEPFPMPPEKIDFILLTHAHIDHSGYIPRLIKEGFRGKIYATAATRDLCSILLPDCGHLMEEEADWLNRKHKTKHHPALPLYTKQEGEAALAYFEPLSFGVRKHLDPDLSFELQYVGHILGAASAILYIGETRIGFTGDAGRPDDLIFRAPESLPPLDYLVTESTYGHRRHSASNPMEELAKLVNDSFDRKGVVLVPSFAVGRAQSLIYMLAQLQMEKRIPKVPIYLDSPMATDVGEIFCEHQKLHRLTKDQCRIFSQAVSYVRSVEDSKHLNEMKGPLIIIAGSGMLGGGRILHHLKTRAGDANNTILLTGYQAAGTRGEALLAGAEELKVHGEYLPIKARVERLENMSAHADAQELIQWFSKTALMPKRVFITHGEPSASDELRRRLHDVFGWRTVVPELGSTVRLETESFEALNKQYLAQAEEDFEQHYDVDGVSISQGEVITSFLS
jgi:metallo-beta-lactamase family protein